jgi:hypothetical protein
MSTSSLPPIVPLYDPIATGSPGMTYISSKEEIMAKWAYFAGFRPNGAIKWITCGPKMPNGGRMRSLPTDLFLLVNSCGSPVHRIKFGRSIAIFGDNFLN